jgi:diaminopimelate epimerase
MIRFARYHALGNDYLVIEPSALGGEITPDQIRAICHRHTGVGSDGVLWGPRGSGDFSVRIFNPDGSEAEKSGNGLRIFARYLYDTRRVGNETFAVQTKGGRVTAQIEPERGRVTVEMGRVSFDSAEIPLSGPRREALDETLELGGRTVRYCAATIGNPHCVVIGEIPTPELARTFGPWIEIEPSFPNRTNVQFLEVLDRNNIRIEIWERGAGYTLASGSSSCAAAAVARRLGLCDEQIAVHMPGGRLDVTIRPDWAAVQTGPVQRICVGEIDPAILISE